MVPYTVLYGDTRFPSSIFIKLDKKVFQRIRNNKSFEFRVIFKVFREVNCQSMSMCFKRCKKKNPKNSKRIFLFDNDKFEQKRHYLYLNNISFNAFSTNRNTVRLIYVVTNRPEEPVEKKKCYLC